MDCCDYDDDDYFYSDDDYYDYTDEESEDEFLDSIAHRYMIAQLSPILLESEAVICCTGLLLACCIIKHQ